MLLISVCTVALGVWARLYHLGFPPRILWDEKYFPAMANKYLQGVYQFDLHPPLGKFIIAIGISLLGNEPLGWRIMPTLFGLALLPLAALLGWYCLKERVGAMLVATFFAAETIFIVHSRIGVMDIFVVFFVLAAFLAALWAQSNRQVIYSSVLLGLARRQVGGLPRCRARRLHPLAQGTAAAVSGGALDLRCRVRRRGLRRSAHYHHREPHTGMGVGVGLARRCGA